MSLQTGLAFGFALAASAAACLAAPATVDGLWTAHVEPLLDRHCFKCHGGVKQKGGLDLRSLENILKGGEHGPAVVPGSPEQSHLFQFVQVGADPHMPPDGKKQLTEEEAAILRAWIGRLPGTNKLLSANTGNSAWPKEYVTALQALQQPVWTPSPKMPPCKAIDRYIALGWKERNAKPSADCDDRTFVRRVYLDLAGRIPTRTELDAFLTDRRRDKRSRLVDTLLANGDYPRHMREVFDVVLMGRRGDNFENQRRDQHWFEFLETAFRENHPWDQVVRDLIVARPAVPEKRGAISLLYERKNNYQELAEAIAPLAFGVQINCAQCHNHPLAWEIEQRHYWGLVAAFNRSKNVDCASGPGVAESAIGGFVNFANLKKESQPALLAFLNGKVVSEKRPAEGDKEEDSPELYLVAPPKEKEKPATPAVPKFSRREALAEAVTRDNPLLARAFVNRVWAMLMGRGLVHPVDQMDSRHRPSHPELLDWLARDFERSGYDVKRLIREIVLSRSYQLDSKPRGSRRQEALESRRTNKNKSLLTSAATKSNGFAHALEKALSGEQLYRSFLIATGTELVDGKVAGHEESEIRRAFVARFPDLFAAEYSLSLQQAMFLSNSALLDDLLRSRPGNTTERLLELGSSRQRVEQAFLSVFGRQPDGEELAAGSSFLEKRTPEAGLKQLLWALLTSAEFQVNH